MAIYIALNLYKMRGLFVVLGAGGAGPETSSSPFICYGQALAILRI